MKSNLRYPADSGRSLMLLTALGCLLTAILGEAIIHPTAARSAVAPPQLVPQALAIGPAPPALMQEQQRSTPLAGGSILAARDGRVVCRAATATEAQAMQRNHHQPLRVIGDDATSTAAPEPTRKGLKIILRGTQQLEGFPEAKAAFLRAARTWEALIQNPVTVVIDVDFGPTYFGEPFLKTEYGKTSFQRDFDAASYPAIRAALIRSAGSPQEAALYHALPAEQLPTDLGATTGMIWHVAARRALGLLPPVADPEHENLGPPPAIAFNSAINYDFDPSDGIRPKRSDFTACAMHEIGHVLGFFSGVGIQETHPGAPPQTPDVLDLFRFRPGVTAATFATAPRILSSGGEQVFFGGGPELPFSTGRDDGTGGDGWQAGHWKDGALIGRYLGIMIPIFDYGLRYEITAGDLAALELIGYRTNPLLNAQEAELKADDSAIDTAVRGDGAMIINRLTPPAYPAKLRKVRLLIPAFVNQPDPAGRPITLVYASGNGQPPPLAQFTRLETIVPSASHELFLEFTIPSGPTINSGDFYVGYQAPSPNQGVGFAVDTSGLTEHRSFYLRTDGAGFGSLADVFQGAPASAMIRAIVSTGAPTPPPTPPPVPTPTPRPVFTELTSGAPLNGYIARSAPGGVVFETQYWINVPGGATELRIDLSANTDVDLYVRAGEPVVIQNNDPTAEYRSVSDNQQESITITPGSAPALKAGSYYMMIVNYGPGASTFTINATVTAPAARPVTSVSAASYSASGLASETIAAAFGTRLATTVMTAPGTPECPTCLPTELAGTTVKVKDSAGTERPASLFFVSPGQVNYLIPAGTAVGTATVTITSGDGAVSVGTAQIAVTAPGLFVANGDGQGVAAAYALRVSPNGPPSFEPVAQFDAAQQRFIPRPLNLNPATDEVFLILYGTGLRHHQGLPTISVRIGGVDAPVLFAGPQPYFVGLDQLNLRLPRSLSGRGEMELALTVDGRAANRVSIHVR